MNPSERDELVVVLVVEDGFFVVGRARVRSPALLGNDDVRDGELVPLQTARQNAACLDVAIRVGLSQVEEAAHQHRRNHHFPHACCSERGNSMRRLQE